MNEKRNFRTRVKDGEFLIGTHMGQSDSSITELLGIIGFDYVWIDMEHTSLDKKEILSHLIAAKAGGTASVVRIPWNDPVLAKPILEMGPDGIVFPYIRSVQEAEKAIASCIYPPKGIRGFGPSRVDYLPRAGSYLEEYEKEFAKLIQIEHVDAVNCLEGIVKIEGLDGLIIGPMDLSASIGKLGILDDPEVVELFDHIGRVAVKAGVPLGVSCGFEPKFVQDMIGRGATFISAGGLVPFVKCSGGQMLNDMKKLFTQTNSEYDLK